MSAAHLPSMNRPHYDSLPLGARGVWLIVTEHDTRAFFDLDEWVFYRDPAARDDGSASRWTYDAAWSRLSIGPLGDVEGAPVEVGRRCHYGPGFSEIWWTSRVVEIRPARDDETPPPNGPTWQERDWPEHRFEASCGADVDARGEGDTREEALSDLAMQIDALLDESWRRREASRTARGWAARCDRTGSVLPWVLEHATELGAR